MSVLGLKQCWDDTLLQLFTWFGPEIGTANALQLLVIQFGRVDKESLAVTWSYQGMEQTSIMRADHDLFSFASVFCP